MGGMQGGDAGAALGAGQASGAAAGTGGQAGTVMSGGQSSGAAAGAGGGSSGDGGRGLFDVEVRLASEEDPKAPSTVGIVTWSTAAGTPTSAKIQFGLTTEYGTEAPVDVEAEGLRTLLLGMKPGRTYHFRIVAAVGGQELTSEDFSITTGDAPAATLVSILSYAVISAEEREPGFILTSYWNEAQKGMVLILDADGDIVWWYDSELENGVGKAAISADGRDVWMITGAATLNEPLLRVGIDGLGFETYSNAVGSHDIVPVEGDVMAFAALLSAAEVDRSGQTRTILPPLEVSGGAPIPHCNAIAYGRASGTYAVSNRGADVYLFPQSGATPENTLLLSDIVGSIPGWDGIQHGIELLSNNHLLMFANQEGASETDPNQRFSTAIEFDLADGTEVWRYEGNELSTNYGGVQRLPGGNTLVTYSNAGVIHEVTRDQRKVLEVTTNEYLGYATWLPSLYPPFSL